MRSLAIIGGGSWGTALAAALAPRIERIRLWFYEPELALRVRETRENDIFLPGIRLPQHIEATDHLERAVENVDMVLGVMPSHAARSIYRSMVPLMAPATPVVSATKGLDSISLKRITQVIDEVFGGSCPVAALSGPSFAREVAEGKPTALVCASRDAGLVTDIQKRFSGNNLRVYGSSDPAGVEFGGALKNVIAIGAGICDGLGLGHNAVAALITRGLAEITRLAVALGARAETLAGLAGLGDLVLTCTGDMSRNRQVGLKLAGGAELDGIVASTPMVAEGVRTAAIAIQLAERHGVELPIASEMQSVLAGGRTPREAITRLMSRALKNELETAGAGTGPNERNYS